MQYKMGSLFDGSGGFPLAASMCGIEPVWASEVEPYPIAVTKSRFPNMKHLGDIRNIDGGAIEPVDLITFGSPCQDLSIAGKQAGLKHEKNGDKETTRSGLFMEAIRIIKEMRTATNGKYPTFILWENVPGAFSSNKGEDFRTVLDELVKIPEPQAPPLPMPDKNGWPTADIIMGEQWSVAYRVFDAQYWGVPQRRKRIHLVADFRSGRAGEILFKRESLPGNFEKGGAPWKEIAGNAGNSLETADKTSDCLTFEPGITGRYGGHCYKNIAGTLRARAGDNQLAVVYDTRGNGDGKTVPTITGDHNNRITDYTALAVIPVYCLQGNGIDRAETAGCNGKGWTENICYTLNTIDRPAVCYENNSFGGYCEGVGTLKASGGDNGGGSENLVVEINPPIEYIVRRLTPTECARLQGFPDKWGYPDTKSDFTDEEYAFWLDVRNTHAEINGRKSKVYTKNQMLAWYNKLHSDSAEYKMWGNGIALPTALYVMQGISEALKGSEIKCPL